MISIVRSDRECSPLPIALGRSEPRPVFARGDRSRGLRAIGAYEKLVDGRGQRLPSARRPGAQNSRTSTTRRRGCGRSSRAAAVRSRERIHFLSGNSESGAVINYCTYEAMGANGARAVVGDGPSAAGGMMVLLDYWIPYRLAWLRPQRKSGGNAEDAEACRRVAARLEVSPADLNRAQYFASSIWLRLVALSAILFLAQALSGLFFPKGHQRDLVLNIALSWLFLLAISAMQAGMVAWRAGMTGRHVLRTIRGMSVPGSLLRWGRPRSRDFWLMLIIAVGGMTGILYGVLTHPGAR